MRVSHYGHVGRTRSPPARAYQLYFFNPLAMLPTRSFVHRALLHSQVSIPPYCMSLLSHFLQAVRRYASAAPTAAFAGQKGSNVRLRISPYAPTI